MKREIIRRILALECVIGLLASIHAAPNGGYTATNSAPPRSPTVTGTLANPTNSTVIIPAPGGTATANGTVHPAGAVGGTPQNAMPGTNGIVSGAATNNLPQTTNNLPGTGNFGVYPGTGTNGVPPGTPIISNNAVGGTGNQPGSGTGAGTGSSTPPRF